MTSVYSDKDKNPEEGLFSETCGAKIMTERLHSSFTDSENKKDYVLTFKTGEENLKEEEMDSEDFDNEDEEMNVQPNDQGNNTLPIPSKKIPQDHKSEEEKSESKVQQASSSRRFRPYLVPWETNSGAVRMEDFHPLFLNLQPSSLQNQTRRIPLRPGENIKRSFHNSRPFYPGVKNHPTRLNQENNTGNPRRYIIPPQMERAADPWDDLELSWNDEDHEVDCSTLPLEYQFRIGQPPPRFLSSYKIFLKDTIPLLKKANPVLSPQDIIHLAHEKWMRDLRPSDKDLYHHKAWLDRRRYRDDLLQYKINKNMIIEEYIRSLTAKEKKTVMSTDISTPGKSNEDQMEVSKEGEDVLHEKEEKDDDAGRKDKLKFKSAFKLFKLDHINQVKDNYPDASFKERVQVIKEMWRNLRPNDKFLYVKRSRLDKRRALIEMTTDTIINIQRKNFPDIQPNKPKDISSQEIKAKPEVSADQQNKMNDDIRIDIKFPSLEEANKEQMGGNDQQ